MRKCFGVFLGVYLTACTHLTPACAETYEAEEFLVEKTMGNYKQIMALTDTGKPVVCTYKGQVYEVVGMAEGVSLHRFADNLPANLVFIKKGTAPFFGVDGALISNVKLKQ